MAPTNDLSQIIPNGKPINYDRLVPGAKVYFYKSPSALEVETRGRKAKHLDHYIGPATILRAIGTRSFVIQYLGKKGVARTYQRDASMISLIPPLEIRTDPSEANLEAIPPHLQQSLALSPIEEGEHIIIKDTKEFKTWYCAHVLEKLPDRIKVSYYTTTIPSLAKHSKATYEDKLAQLQKAVFLRTWALPTGEATTVDPKLFRKRNNLWTGLIPLRFLDDVLLVRNVGMTNLGNFSAPTAAVVANLKIAHHVGA